MTTTTALPAWITANLAAGFALGTHFLDDGTEHVTSLELGVAVVDGTGERVHYCHECEDFADDHTVTLDATTETFSATVARLGREYHELHLEHGIVPGADQDRIIAELDAAAERAGINQLDSDDLFAEEIRVGPVKH